LALIVVHEAALSNFILQRTDLRQGQFMQRRGLVPRFKTPWPTVF
jgi:hypothetical protein